MDLAPPVEDMVVLSSSSRAKSSSSNDTNRQLPTMMTTLRSMSVDAAKNLLPQDPVYKWCQDIFVAVFVTEEKGFKDAKTRLKALPAFQVLCGRITAEVLKKENFQTSLEALKTMTEEDAENLIVKNKALYTWCQICNHFLNPAEHQTLLQLLQSLPSFRAVVGLPDKTQDAKRKSSQVSLESSSETKNEVELSESGGFKNTTTRGGGSQGQDFGRIGVDNNNKGMQGNPMAVVTPVPLGNSSKKGQNHHLDIQMSFSGDSIDSPLRFQKDGGENNNNDKNERADTNGSAAIQSTKIAHGGIEEWDGHDPFDDELSFDGPGMKRHRADQEKTDSVHEFDGLDLDKEDALFMDDPFALGAAPGGNSGGQQPSPVARGPRTSRGKPFAAMVNASQNTKGKKNKRGRKRPSVTKTKKRAATKKKKQAKRSSPETTEEEEDTRVRTNYAATSLRARGKARSFKKLYEDDDSSEEEESEIEETSDEEEIPTPRPPSKKAKVSWVAKASKPVKPRISTTEAPVSYKRIPSKFLDNPVILKGGMRLEAKGDKQNLNALHCFVRKELLEVFVIKEGGHRVGIRCVHCGCQPKGKKASMSTFYPKSVEDLYRAVCTWQRIHFKACQFIPEEAKDKYWLLKEEDRTRGKKSHWIVSASAMGLTNVDGDRSGVVWHPDNNDVLQDIEDEGDDDDDLLDIAGLSDSGEEDDLMTMNFMTTNDDFPVKEDFSMGKLEQDSDVGIKVEPSFIAM